MKRTMAKVFGVAAIFSAIFTTAVMAAEISEDVNYKGTVNFDEGAILKIKGVQVTATAANINAGVASSTASLVSNAVLKVYGSNLVIVTGGTVTLPDASIASAALPASIAASTVVSNATLKVYGSNLVVKAGGTVTVPAGSISEASIASLGLTTNIDVLISGSTTNRLVFTNGLLKVVTAL